MNMENTSDLDFEDVDAILGADLDDLDDLPPVGVPPTGHYNLTTSFSIEEVGEDKRQVICATYLVDAINELKDEEEAGDVQVGQEFKEYFYLTKKNGEKNTFGIGTLKQRLAPHAERYGTHKIGELIQQVKQVAISASLKRRVNRKNEDQYNMTLKDVVLL